MGQKFCRWQYGSIFIRLAVVASQICEIVRNSEKIQTYSSSRSSKVVDFVANRKRTCNFLLVISSNWTYLVPFSRYWRIKLENSLFSPPHPCLTPRSEETRQNFWIKLIPQKLEGWGYCTVKLHDPNFNRFWLIHPCDRQRAGRTDGRSIAYSALCICCRALKTFLIWYTASICLFVKVVPCSPEE